MLVFDVFSNKVAVKPTLFSHLKKIEIHHIRKR